MEPAAEPPLSPADRGELIVAGVLAALYTMPGLLLLGASTDTDNPAFRFYWPPIYGLTLLLCARRRRELGRTVAATALIALVVGWACLSKGWSILPEVTGRRTLALVMTTLFGLYLGSAWSPRRLVRLVATTFSIMAGVSLVLVLAFRRYGVEQAGELAGDWRGLWSSKNALAALMALGGLACICTLFAAPRRRWPWLLGLGLCVLLLLGSRGKTSLVVLLLTGGGAAGLAFARRGPAAAALGGLAAGAAVFFGALAAAVRPDLLLALVGKDATLTGRTQIWAAVGRRMAESPWLGYGFGAFWDKEAITAKIVRHEARWEVPTAHNGWLDLLVQVGAVGVALFALVLLVVATAAVWRAHRRGDGFFAPLYVLLYVVISLSESVLMERNSLSWVLFAAVACQVLQWGGPPAGGRAAARPPAPAAADAADFPWPAPLAR